MNSWAVCDIDRLCATATKTGIVVFKTQFVIHITGSVSCHAEAIKLQKQGDLQ